MGEDAVAFVYFVPAGLNIHQDVHVASTEVTISLRFLPELLRIMSNSSEFIHTSQLGVPPADNPQGLNECEVDDPEMIFVHPQSQFYLDIQNDSRSLSLPPFPNNIRFPTRTSFLDSMIATPRIWQTRHIVNMLDILLTI